MARIAVLIFRSEKRRNKPHVYFWYRRRSAQQILTEAGVSWDKKVKDWTDEESNAIRTIISEKHRIEAPQVGNTARH